jgi:hypothetical protein
MDAERLSCVRDAAQWACEHARRARLDAEAARRRAILVLARSQVLRTASTVQRSATPTPLESQAHGLPPSTPDDAARTGQLRDT